MSAYVGIDVHRERSQVAVIDRDGKILADRNVPNGVKSILSVIGGLPAGNQGGVRGRVRLKNDLLTELPGVPAGHSLDRSFP